MQVLKGSWCCIYFLQTFRNCLKIFNMRCRITPAWKFLENHSIHYAKNLSICMQHTKLSACFCYLFANFFSKKLVDNLLGIFQIFPCTLFIITSHQKLSCGYNLFISCTFLLWLPETFVSGNFLIMKNIINFHIMNIIVWKNGFSKNFWKIFVSTLDYWSKKWNKLSNRKT